METTDRATVRATPAFRRPDGAIVEVNQEVSVVINRRSRPIVAFDSNKVQTYNGVAKTRSRVPDGGSTAELAGEVHASIGPAV